MSVGVADLVSCRRSFLPSLTGLVLAGEGVGLLYLVIVGVLATAARSRAPVVCRGLSILRCWREMLISLAMEMPAAALSALSDSSMSTEGLVTLVATEDIDDGDRFRVLLAVLDDVAAELGGVTICH